MKKLMLMILVLFCIQVSAQDLKFKGFIESGYENRIINIDPSNPYHGLENCGFTTFNLSLTYKNLSIYSTNKNYFKPLRLFAYSPRQIEYYFGIKYSIKKFDINFEHLCSHDVDESIFYEEHTRVSIKFNLLP